MHSVLKFGGTSLADKTRLDAVVQLCRDVSGAVVVSAIGDTTDRLLAASSRAETGDQAGAIAVVESLQSFHLAMIAEASTKDAVVGLFKELHQLIGGIVQLRELTARSRAALLSFGERLAVQIVASVLRSAGIDAEAVDARELIRTDGRYDEATVDVDATRQLVQRRLVPYFKRGTLAVVTGFIGSSEQGRTTTLGRSGSDYSATLLGACADVDQIVIYTDVAGVYTADPRLVPEATALSHVSYREAAEMSYFGAKVLHSKAIRPAALAKIPVWVRSTLEPDAPGTLISAEPGTAPFGVKTVSSVEGLALLTLEGRGMFGAVGIARRIFEACELAEANVVMISQASSEQSVSVVVGEDCVARLEAAIRERLAPEFSQGTIETLRIEQEIAVVSIVGAGMAGSPGISSRLFGALGEVRVNVLAIAQGATELSISVAMAAAQVERAVRAIHGSFGLTKRVNLVLLGHGNVGRELVSLIEQNQQSIAKRLSVELRIIGAATRSHWLADAQGIAPGELEQRLRATPERPDDHAMLDTLASMPASELVLIDVTAADCFDLHAAALTRGFHLVTANKKPLSGAQRTFDELARLRTVNGVRYDYETTFGAALPALHALREFENTGDTVLSVEGCLSGTLGFICSQLDQDDDLQRIVAEAKELGFTEPDPREDLNGMDVARKALIIARTVGLNVEPEEIQLEALVPGLEAGLEQGLQAYQETLAGRLAQAREQGQVLRYVASISPQQVTVGLRAVAQESPLGSLSGPDNMLVIRSRRYDANPLVIRGPGAGAEVTAAGVLGDVLKVATFERRVR